LTRKNVAIGAAIIIAAALTIAGVLAAISTTRTIPSSGTIQGINLYLYWDSGFTNATSSIDWGSSLTNGTSVNETIYVRNIGTTSMTLSMTTNTWNPANATGYLTLTWDKEGATVPASSYVVANLTLAVSSTFTTGTAFSNDITITGTH
jgi:hypothetical protein